MAIRRSVVKWFDAQKGFGFLEHPDGGPDVFVHYTQIVSNKKFKVLRTGRPVSFELVDGHKGVHARQVEVLEKDVRGPVRPPRDRFQRSFRPFSVSGY